MTIEKHQTDVCIVGGGPAGMLLGLLLARQDIRVLVLEQHADFEREYRGEVLMPGFTQLFKKLELFSYLEQFPHSKLTSMDFFAGKNNVAHIKFEDICPEVPFALWMPQPVLLDALHQKAKSYESFDLWFNASVKSLIKECSHTKGIIATVAGEDVEISAQVTVGADGRFSKVHQLGQFDNSSHTHYFDVLWFSVDRPEGFEHTAQTYLRKDRMCLILPKYPDLIQCGILMPPDEYIAIKRKGIDAMKVVLKDNCPEFLWPFIDSLTNFKAFHPLQSITSFTREWAQDGLLLIGDAAHTCSPVGGIGVSVAVTAAAVAARVIEQALQVGDVSAATLGEVQKIRQDEVQRIQKRQGGISGVATVQSPLLKMFLPVLIQVMINSGLLQKQMRQIVAFRDLEASLGLRHS